MKKINRRNFIKYAGTVIAASAFGKFVGFPVWSKAVNAATEVTVAEHSADKPVPRAVDGAGTTVDPGKNFGLIIDIGACIGCRTCQWGCKQENNIPDDISPPWIEVFEFPEEVELTSIPSMEELQDGTTTSYTEAPREGKRYMPIQCNHCDNAPCVKVCPTGATYKDEDGYVLMDYDRCIGCRFCVVACPFGNRRFNWKKPTLSPENINPKVPVRPSGVAEKCTFCVHRTRNGILPRCVEVCPVRARHFGDFNDPSSEVSKILKSNPGFRLLEELNTKPRIWYILRGKKFLE